MLTMTRRLKKGRVGAGVSSRREVSISVTIRDVMLAGRRRGDWLHMLVRQVLVHTSMRQCLRGGRKATEQGDEERDQSEEGAPAHARTYTGTLEAPMGGPR